MFFEPEHRRTRRPDLRRVARTAAGALLLSGIAFGATLAAREVTVEPGDTLSAISRRTGVPVARLAEANRLADPDLIRAGEVLVIPEAGGGGGGTTHVVRPGDTLWSIARRAGTTVEALAAANGLDDPDLIRAGDTLVLAAGRPSGDGPAEPAAAAPEPAPAPAPAPAAPATTAPPTTAAPAPPAAVPAGGRGGAVVVSYVVREGDSLSSIASRFGISAAELRRANRMGTDVVRPGQRLVVPVG